jgi:hypothetical protein
MLALLKTLGVVADGAVAVTDFTSWFAYNGWLMDSSTVGYPSTVVNTSASP